MTSDTRWLVVGANGMLGQELVAQLSGRDASGVDLPDIDITDASSVTKCLDGYSVVVNCAAWTAVDDAEEHESTAFIVNAVGPANLARACATNGAKLVHISTDYVFDGTATSPYDEDAQLNPMSAYGRTKAAGEWAVRAEHPNDSYIFRTAWLYGAGGPNFVKTMVKLESERDTLSVVDDQIGQPTWARDLAKQIVSGIDAEIAPGIYHATSAGQTSWYGFTRKIFEACGADPDRVQPATTDQFPRPAPRPAFSVLGHDRWAGTGVAPMRSWDEAFADAWASGLTTP